MNKKSFCLLPTYQFYSTCFPIAFHSFGAAGKMTVEVSMIGFMVGTCIAFFVVIGDLAPPIIASILNMSQSVNFSYAVQGVICFFLVLPLTLLRNLDSLFVVSISSVVFYCFVMLHIVFAAKSSIYDGTWTSSVMWYRGNLFRQSLKPFIPKVLYFK